MGTKKKESSVNKYKLRLYQIRVNLERKGIKQPIKEMILRNMIEDNKNNHNYLLGRIVNEDFLYELETLDVITNE
jgi:hypothetical protein